MRDNAKGGALTEVTFFILLSLYTPKHGYAVMQFIEDSTKGYTLISIIIIYIENVTCMSSKFLSSQELT